MLQQMTKEF